MIKHKKYKPGQLVTINHRVFRIVKKYYCMDDCLCCFDRNYEKYVQKGSMTLLGQLPLIFIHSGGYPDT